MPLILRADDAVDEILSQSGPVDEHRRVVRRVDHGLCNREVGTEAKVDQQVAEARHRLMVRGRAKVRVRLS